MAAYPESDVCESDVYSLKEIVNRQMSFRLRSMTRRIFTEALKKMFRLRSTLVFC